MSFISSLVPIPILILHRDSSYNCRSFWISPIQNWMHWMPISLWAEWQCEIRDCNRGTSLTPSTPFRPFPGNKGIKALGWQKDKFLWKFWNPSSALCTRWWHVCIGFGDGTRVGLPEWVDNLSWHEGFEMTGRNETSNSSALMYLSFPKWTQKYWKETKAIKSANNLLSFMAHYTHIETETGTLSFTYGFDLQWDLQLSDI